MTPPDDTVRGPESATTLVKRRPPWRVSLIWLVPVIAILLGLSVAVRKWTSVGPHIEISFNSADGLEAGKTQVRFKNVVIGSVGAITLSTDLARVIVDVKLTKSARAFATEGSRFWIVRPRVGTGGISGIDTLLSGAYIGADAGQSQTPRKSFIGLETPPAVTQGEKGRQFLLHADDVGSLDIGSPIYYRRIQVGRIVAVKLGADGRQIGLAIFVDAPYDRLVASTTRFWNASGLDVSLGAGGLKVNTQSLATVIGGGIAFQSPPHDAQTTPAAPDTLFKLAPDLQTAMAQPDGEPLAIEMRFAQPMRGLAVDAPVVFEGLDLGRVTSIDLDYDPASHGFSTVVEALLYPQRMGRAFQKMRPEIQDSPELARADILGGLVDKGLRAQARSANLLTGQLYVAIDFIPGTSKVAFDARSTPFQIPTVPGQLDQLQQQIASIANKLDKIPFDSIGRRLDTGLASLDQTLGTVNSDVLPALHDTLDGAKATLGTANKTLSSVDGLVNDDSALRHDVTQTLQELQRSAQSLRELTDYLGRHPESLIRGRAVPKPTGAPATLSPSNP